MKKRIISCIIAAVLILSCLSFTAFADDADAAQEVASGQCGDDVYWTLTEDGVLTVSGTGDMWDQLWHQVAYDYVEDITEIVIEEGVTDIGRSAFDDFYYLEKVTIADSVEYIGPAAFNECIALTDISFGSGVTEIDYLAFGNCDSLESIDLPESLTYIGYGAFQACPLLVDVELPSGLETLCYQAFAWCYSLESVTFTGSAPEVCEDDGRAEDDGVTFEYAVFADTDSVTVYYPDDESWTDEVIAALSEDADNITWVAYDADENEDSGEDEDTGEAETDSSDSTDDTDGADGEDTGEEDTDSSDDDTVNGYPMVISGLKTGDQVIMYSPADLTALTTTEHEYTLEDGTAVTLLSAVYVNVIYDEGWYLLEEYDASILTVYVDENGYIYFISEDGEFLTLGENGISTSFESEASVYSRWTLEEIDGAGSYYLWNESAGEYLQNFFVNTDGVITSSYVDSVQFYLVAENAEVSEINITEAEDSSEGEDTGEEDVSTVSVETAVTEGTPDTDAEVDEAALIDYVLTDEEKEILENGGSAEFTLEVSSADEDISEEDKAIAEETVADDEVIEEYGELTIGLYLDISLYLTITDSEGESATRSISETGTDYTITVTLPDELINTDESIERTYYVIRIHDGEAEILEAVYDEENGTLTFAADKFSTYAIAYKDSEAQEAEADAEEAGQSRQDTNISVEEADADAEEAGSGTAVVSANDENSVAANLSEEETTAASDSSADTSSETSSSSADVGDRSNLLFWLIVGMLAAGSLAAEVVRRRNRA